MCKYRVVKNNIDHKYIFEKEIKFLFWKWWSVSYDCNTYYYTESFDETKRLYKRLCGCDLKIGDLIIKD